MDVLATIFLGFISSVFSAIILIYFVFWYWKPSIEISNHISKSNENGIDLYKIKFINYSKYSANEVEVELWQKTEYKATSNSGGRNVKMEKLKLSTENWLSIDKFISDKSISKIGLAPHCITIKILAVDLQQILNHKNHISLSFKISVKHGLSNITKTFSKDYNDENCIKSGRFVFGNNLNIEAI